MNRLEVPEKIKTLLEGKSYQVDDVGMSGNQVLLFEDMVLKIEENSPYMEKQVQVMQWLWGKMPVPQVLAYEVWNGKSYLLMSKLTGLMSCDTYYLDHPDVLLEALAQGFHMLWSLDITDCPRVRDLDVELAEAKRRVIHHLVDLENVEPDTFGEHGFQDPEALLQWLEQHRPTMEPVFSHGDFCLPNIFLKDGCISGFIDLGDAGVGDKWRDISLCYRSLKHNFDGTYSGKVYPDFQAELLFEKIGVEPNWDKLRYYLLLDELF